MKIVMIHGIGQTYLGGPQILSKWVPALLSGLVEAGGPRISEQDCTAVGYGAIFRPRGQRGIVEATAQNLEAWEQDMLVEWWREATRLSELNRPANDKTGEDPTLQGPSFKGRARVPKVAQRALEQVARSRFFRAIGTPDLVLRFLRQVRLFLNDAEIKSAILARVNATVTPATRVLIGHSLGTIVAYEALCSNPDWRVHTLLTLGSPLAVPELVFDRLTPRPQNGCGVWPNVQHWINIADDGDIVALVKALAPYFPVPTNASLTDFIVYNGWASHSAERYLSTREAGQAVATALA
jgi:PGAP1-like protein